MYCKKIYKMNIRVFTYFVVLLIHCILSTISLSCKEDTHLNLTHKFFSVFVYSKYITKSNENRKFGKTTFAILTPSYLHRSISTPSNQKNMSNRKFQFTALWNKCKQIQIISTVKLPLMCWSFQIFNRIFTILVGAFLSVNSRLLNITSR